MTSRLSVGVIGGAGYAAGELLRILLRHPSVDVAFVQSESQAGASITSVHRDLLSFSHLKFVGSSDSKVDCVFLCKGHGNSAEILRQQPRLLEQRLIDLSQDFRISSNFVYGLPEANRARIREAMYVANPGCFATGLTLALLPLASVQALGEIHATAITGSTGAGQALSDTSHFSWRSHNLSVYKAFDHQHLPEVKAVLNELQPGWGAPLNLVPMRGPFSRGILVSAYLESELSDVEAKELYAKFYETHPFTHVTEVSPDLKQVVNTNNCAVAVAKVGTKLHIVSVIDNLLKGAAGQAVQNMNVMFRLSEISGLDLKGSAF